MHKLSDAGGWLFERPYVLLVLTTLFWAGNAVAGKLAAGVVPPFTLTLIRWTATAIALYFIAGPRLAEQWPTVRKNLPFLFACGATGFAVFNFCLYGGLQYTTAINVAIQQSGMPMVIMIGMYLVYREKITPLQGIGAIVSILGVLFTATRGDLPAILRLDVNIGDAIMLGAVLAYSAYSVAIKNKPNLDWRVFMFCAALAAAITSVPFAGYEMATGNFIDVGPTAIGLLIYVSVFPSLLAQIFYLRGVEMVGANRAGLFINFVPIFAAILAVGILGEVLEFYHFLGLGLVLTGIAMAEISARRKLAVEGER